MPDVSSPPTATVPRVSYLALCFNHARWLDQCLGSIEAQRWPNAELIILDNASSDGSADLIRARAAVMDLPVTLLAESERRGICANANRLLAQASGDYVALVSTDDWWFPEKTRRQVEALERLGRDWAVAYADAICVDEQGERHPAPFIASHRPFDSLPSGDILTELVRGPFIPAMSTLVRREALVAAGGYDESLVYEDYDMWLRLAVNGRFHADPDPLCAYRIVASSMIRTVAAQDRPEKILSDARIMAKAAAIARLPAKMRRNSLRRVVTLAAKLIGQPGIWTPAVGELKNSTGLQSLALLEAAARAGGLDEAAVLGLLSAAASRGILPPNERDILPKGLVIPEPSRWPDRPASPVDWDAMVASFLTPLSPRNAGALLPDPGRKR
ncbi:MAG: glycosyltransferase [Verrucomicrobiales bacterium]